MFLQPKPEDLELPGIHPVKFMEQLLALCGLCNARDYCGITLHVYLVDDLKITPHKPVTATYL